MTEIKYTRWRKSRHSDGTGNCVEVAYPYWRKSSYSSGTGNCVEVASAERIVGVRDSKQHGSGPVLEFTAEAWAAFLRRAKGGEFDL